MGSELVAKSVRAEVLDATLAAGSHRSFCHQQRSFAHEKATRWLIRLAFHEGLSQTPSKEFKVSFKYSKLTKLLAGAAAALAIAGCGGSNGGAAQDPVPAPTDKVSGLAAVGAPVTGAQVVLRCANGVTGQTTTDDEGRWNLELSNPQYPCLATLSNATSHPGLTLRSIAQTVGYVNITPLTELVLARAAKQASSSLDDISGAALLELASSLETALAEVVTILVAQGFPASDLAVFTGQFEATKGDRYDDLLEQIAISLADDGKTLDDLIEVISEADPENVPPLPNTLVMSAATLAAMPQINKASLSIEEGLLKMSLEAGSNTAGAFVGGGTGNKAVLQLAGLNGMKLRDFHSMTVELQGDEAGVTATPVSPYVAINLTIDPQCSADPIPSDATLNQLRERRRILSFDPYYHFIQPAPRLSSEELTVMTVTPATPGWRPSAGSAILGKSQPDFNPNNHAGRLEEFDFESYPEACIVDGATGDAGMFRDVTDETCATINALDGTAPARCGLPYSGALLFLGSSSATQASNWLVREIKVFRKENVNVGGTPDDSAEQAIRTYRFQ